MLELLFRINAAGIIEMVVRSVIIWAKSAQAISMTAPTITDSQAVELLIKFSHRLHCNTAISTYWTYCVNKFVGIIFQPAFFVDVINGWD